ncbi:hypothetical protein [Roseitalea porphyridii]|uniref:Uncharacterized protein n=1 Tax=Roseitalea porphyridii TaxID=1852022 RepID=A0A4P6UYD2_9HYPH|nr:hypothetical protein [Roseitalea porphyridii]QBK29785.1 hypothetical protein E0E05_03720 [Roseitalea porphyridii]
MKEQTVEYEMKTIDIAPFSDIAGEDVVSFIFEHAPRKVTTRVAKALDHYVRATMLIDLDEEMGAIRLIAAEEELVVAIFEWLKLNEDRFPEHRDFVRKFKNHVVKLSFYPTLAQFRFILGDMLAHGFTMEGLEDVLNWTAMPVIDGKEIKLAIIDGKGEELIRHNPLAVSISRDDIPDEKIVETLLKEFTGLVERQQKKTLKAFLLERADFRNKLLYASDAGSLEMADRLVDLIDEFKQTYHDLLWTLAVLIGAEPAIKHWGLVSQFIALYRRALIEAGVLRADNTVAEAE